MLLAVFAPLLAPSDPLAQHVAQGAQAPSAAHWFGTDKLGRDVFARILYGARISIRIGFVAVGLAITAGTLIGLVAGYAGKRVEAVLMGAMDVMLAFPSIILAIGITTILGPSITNLMLAVGIVYVPQYARLARSSVLAVKEHEYVEAARAIGARHARDPGAARPAQHPRAAAGSGDARGRDGRARGGRAVVSGPRRAAAGAGVGRDAQRRARLLALRAVGADLPGGLDHRAGARASTCWATACATRSTPSSAEPPMIVVALALAAALFYGAADFCGGLATRRSSALAVVVWSQAVGSCVLLAALPVVPGCRAAGDVGWGLPAASPARSPSDCCIAVWRSA